MVLGVFEDGLAGINATVTEGWKGTHLSFATELGSNDRGSDYRPPVVPWACEKIRNLWRTRREGTPPPMGYEAVGGPGAPSGRICSQLPL